MSKVFLLLGSNINPAENIKQALFELEGYHGWIVDKISNLYETFPSHGYGHNFYNIAVLIHTEMGIKELKRNLMVLEEKLGRKRTEEKNNTKIIDIDIVFFDGLISNKYPDREFTEFPYIALPVSELDPAFVHQLTARPLSHYTDKFKNQINKTVFLVKSHY